MWADGAALESTDGGWSGAPWGGHLGGQTAGAALRSTDCGQSGEEGAPWGGHLVGLLWDNMLNHKQKRDWREKQQYQDTSIMYLNDGTIG